MLRARPRGGRRVTGDSDAPTQRTRTHVGAITVGHVEVDGLWVEIPAEQSVSIEEVVSRSGLAPRDGTQVRCFFSSGRVVEGDRVLPGEKVLIGTRPPRRRASHVEVVPRTHDEVEIWWIKDIDGSGRRFNGSGIVDGSCTLWVPGVIRGSTVRAVELTRSRHKNGKMHAQGYMIRTDAEPYSQGDLVLVTSSGESSMRLFDPLKSSLSIDVDIIPNSLDAARRLELERGSRPVWVLKISGFDPEGRRALASVERSYTWWGRSR